jgi:hypothetical protein
VGRPARCDNVRCVVAAINEDDRLPVELNCVVNLPFLKRDPMCKFEKVVPADTAKLIIKTTRSLVDFYLVDKLRDGASPPITNSQRMRALTTQAMSEVAAAASKHGTEEC